MKNKHILFWELGADDPIDEAHLAECEECRRNFEANRLLSLQLRSVPQIVPPPFFAARLQSLAGESRRTLIYYFERMAAHLAPVLTLLIVATGFLIYSVSTPEAYQPALVLEEAAFPEISVENILGAPAVPEGPNHE